MDFGRTVEVCAVATQGDVNGDEWVHDFYLSFSSDGATWATFTDENGTQVVSNTVIYLKKIEINKDYRCGNCVLISEHRPSGSATLDF